MKKNDVIIGRAVDYSYEGAAIVKPEGLVVFVRNLAVGETAKIVITRLDKRQGYGKALEILDPSAQRQDPGCPNFPQCGGCALRHLSYPAELRFKEERVVRELERAGIRIPVQSIIGMDNPLHYRNKLQAPVQAVAGKLEWGFYRVNSHDLIRTGYCAIEDEAANRLINDLCGRLGAYPEAGMIRHILIRVGKSTGEAMAVIVTRKSAMPGLREIAARFLADNPAVRSVIQNVNGRDTNVILGAEEVVLAGAEQITERLGRLSFRISARSFFQVNPAQAVRLYDTVKEYAGLRKEETVLDLYCGIGTITLWLAGQARQAIGVEIVAKAIADAKQNAQDNQIANASFYAASAAQGAALIRAQGVRPDVITVDPPRKGLDAETLRIIVDLAPQRIVYVSCDPATLARDLKWLGGHGYLAVKAQPVDMFPGTPHVETVVLMSRVEGK